MTADLVASVGLGLDIIGAVFVVRNLFWISDDELARAADRVGVYGGPNVKGAPQVFPRAALLALFRASRRDARIGALLLIAGFGAQLVARWL
ncbi:MAG: hypothetical protein ACRDGT_02445 [Candidatus Limnocylindria bacterium]